MSKSSKRVRSRRARPSKAEDIARTAKALAHPARVEIVVTALLRRACSGQDIVDAVGLAHSTTSEHLRILREAGVVVGKAVPPRVSYSIAPAAIASLKKFLERIEAHPGGRGR